MKKLLLTLGLVATSVAAMADRWTPVSSTYGTTETPLYVSVTINTDVTTTVPQLDEIAAFVDGECRASSTTLTTTQTGLQVYVLRVRGLDSDEGKPITIKALYGGLVYKFTRTETFDSEYVTHDRPVALTLNPLREIGVEENPIWMVIGSTYSLPDHLIYYYGATGGDNSDATAPIDQDETPLTVTYDAANSSSYISVDENGLMTALRVGEAGVGIYVRGPEREDGTYSFEYSVWPGVRITLPEVEEIVVNPTELTVYTGDNLNDLIRSGRISISMLPAEADQGYDWEADKTIGFPWNANYMFERAGDFQVNVVSTANPDVEPVTVTFHVKEPLSLYVGEDAYAGSIGMMTPMTFNVYMNTDEGFDPTLLTIECHDKRAIPTIRYEVGQLAQTEETPAAGPIWYVPVTLYGRFVGEIGYNILYNNEPICDYLNAFIYPEIAINPGWQWVSPYAYESSAAGELITAEGGYARWLNNIIEMRTQEGLLCNDEFLGLFGDITDFNFSNGMYKVKSSSTEQFKLILGEGEEMELAQYNEVQLEPGYNWVVYPYEYALGINELESIVEDPNDGDQIFGKDGSIAEYDAAEATWVGDLTFQPGAGYMYYCNGENGVLYDPYFPSHELIPACYQEDNTQPVKSEMGLIMPDWLIDRSRFADNMSVVAEVEGLSNPNEWVLGAFVGNECRGQGRAVRGGIMFIGVAGKSGEKVNFRLHNNRTGEEFDVTEGLTYTMKVGSLKAPLHLTSEGATGITGIASKSSNSKTIYDLSGRRVEKATKGIYVVNGKKVIY